MRFAGFTYRADFDIVAYERSIVLSYYLESAIFKWSELNNIIFIKENKISRSLITTSLDASVWNTNKKKLSNILLFFQTKSIKRKEDYQQDKDDDSGDVFWRLIVSSIDAVRLFNNSSTCCSVLENPLHSNKQTF